MPVPFFNSSPTFGGGTIQALFLEQPLLLVPLLVVVQLVLIGVWSKRRTLLTRRLMLGGLVVFPLLLALQALVATDRERLEARCQAMSRAVQSGDLEALADHVSESFAAEGAREGTPIDKAGLIALLQRVLHTYSVEEARLSRFEFQVTGDRATVSFTASCRLITPNEVIPHFPSQWELDFVLSEQQWLATDIRPQPSRFLPYRRLGDIPR